MNCKLPDVQADFRKGRGTRDQIANIRWIMEKARESQKNIYFCFIDYAKAFDCVDHNKLWKILKEMGTPDHLTCLLRNLYAGQEAIVRTGKALRPDVLTKSGIMVGLGETDDEVLQVMHDMRQHNVDMLTIGQYLQPTNSHLAVQRYVTPEQFAAYKQQAQQMGFKNAAVGAMVRSSYHADVQASGIVDKPA